MTSASWESDLAQAAGQLDLFKNNFGQMDLNLDIDFAKFEAELAAVQAIAKVAPIQIPVEISGLVTALGEFAAAAAAMRLMALTAGGPGGGGLLAVLGWGGGTFGFAAFGSVLSLAGFGFEHLATIVLGLAGSSAGGRAELTPLGEKLLGSRSWFE